MFWRWFVSDRKVLEELLETNEVYDICPNAIQMPANANVSANEEAAVDENGKPRLTLWKDFQYSEEEAEIKVEEYWAAVAANRNS
jgi:hypothetical protein